MTSLDVKPITPEVAFQQSTLKIPAFVIDVFNDLIITNLNASCSIVFQEDIVNAIIDKLKQGAYTPATGEAISDYRTFIFDKHWLDIEHVFAEAGWDVEYYKPAHYEICKARFTFSKKTIA